MYTIYAVSTLLMLGQLGGARQDTAGIPSEILAHQAAIQSVHDISCKLTLQSQNKGVFETFATGIYYRAGDQIRIVLPENRAGYSEDLLVKDSEILSIGKYSNNSKIPGTIGAIRKPANDLHTTCDVWRYMLLSFPTFDLKWKTLAEIAERPGGISRISNATISGSQLVDVELDFKDVYNEINHVHVYLNPQYNYLCSEQRWAGESNLGKSLVVIRVLRFEEVSPGVFFPVQTESDFSDGKSTSKVRATLDDVKANVGLPPDVFRLEIPPGIKMMDEIEGKIYHLDAAGRRYGKEEPFDPSSSPPPLRIMPNAGFKQSIEGPSDYFLWISLASLAALICGVIVLAITKGRKGCNPSLP